MLPELIEESFEKFTLYWFDTLLVCGFILLLRLSKSFIDELFIGRDLYFKVLFSSFSLGAERVSVNLTCLILLLLTSYFDDNIGDYSLTSELLTVYKATLLLRYTYLYYLPSLVLGL